MGSARGQAHWPPPQAGATPGRRPTVPGVTHLIACAQMGPIRTPGGPPNPRGRVPHQRLSRAFVTPAPPGTLWCWSLPPCFRPQGRPPVPRPLPCSLAPAMSRLPLLSAPALACWCPLLFVFGFFSLPPPMSPRCLLAVLALFVGGWRRRGRGGGASSLSALLRKHVVSTAQARGAALVPPLGGGGGLPRGSRRHPTLPAVAPSAVPPFPLGSLWARSCGSSRTLVRLPPHSAAASSGGGPLPATVTPLVPSPSPRCPRPFPWWVWELGVGRGGAPSLPFLWRKHVAGTALAHGAALVLLLGSGARLVAPVIPPPTLRPLPRCPPRWGLHGACFPWARSCSPSRTLSPLPPHLAALSSGGEAAVRPSLPASPTLGGAEVCGGGGACRFPFVALMPQARGAASVPLQGVGACLAAPVVALSTLRSHPRWSPRRGLHGACPPRARSCGSSRTLLPLPPHPAALPSGGGVAFRSPPTRIPRPLGGGVGWGGVGAPLSSPLLCTHVAGMT